MHQQVCAHMRCIGATLHKKNKKNVFFDMRSGYAVGMRRICAAAKNNSIFLRMRRLCADHHFIVNMIKSKLLVCVTYARTNNLAEKKEKTKLFLPLPL